MIDAISTIQPWLLALMLTAPRIMIIFTIMPMFARGIFPALIRNGVMVVLSLAILPLTFEQLREIDLTPDRLMVLLIKEAVVGLLIGYLMSIPFWAVRGVGFLMDLQRGAMSAIFFSPTAGGMVSPLGNLLAQLATTILFVSGGFLILMESIMLSYQIWPLHTFIPEMSPQSMKFFLQQLDLLMYTIILIVGPFIGLMLIIDFGIGLVGRYLPQLNVFLIAMPVKSGLLFFMLIFYITFIGNYLRDTFLKFGSNLNLLSALLNE